MKKFIKEYWLLLTVASIVVILDQVTKTLVRENIPFGGRWMPLDWLAPYFRFVHWENTGAAFGLFQDGGLIFALLAVIVSTFIVIYYPQIPKDEQWMRFAMALQMGGALGNLIDRIVFGPVTDFISVGNFAVFNIADASITVGVALLILALWISERKGTQEGYDLEASESDQPETVDNQL